MWGGSGADPFSVALNADVFLPSASSSSAFPAIYRLVGLVVKASASRAEGPGFESRLHRDFFGAESYQ